MCCLHDFAPEEVDPTDSCGIRTASERPTSLVTVVVRPHGVNRLASSQQCIRTASGRPGCTCAESNLPSLQFPTPDREGSSPARSGSGPMPPV